MHSQFNLGDTVRLKTGGPTMTVNALGNNADKQPMVWCDWYNDKKKKETGVFDPTALEVAYGS